MQKIFSTEGKIYGGMERVYQVLLLNVVFILSCLPLLTIGAAITAAYGTAYKMTEHREGILYKTYWHQFKQNFLPATKMWLLIVGVITGILLALPYFRYFIIGNKIAYYLVMIGVTYFLLVNLYLFPLIARFENTLKATVINAMILSLKYLPISIILFFVTVGGIFVLPIYLPKLLFVWLFTGMGTVFFINAKLLLKVFNQYENIEERS